MDPNLLVTCRQMLQHAHQVGQLPLAYIMNPYTNRYMTGLAAAESRPKQSIFQRALFKARKKHLILQVFCGVPILQNQYLPDGYVTLQFAPTLQPRPVPVPAQQAAPVPGNPFVKREPLPIQEAPINETGPTLEDIASGSDGMPTVSDVLIRGLEGADSLKQVVVIRVYKNDDVDMSMNCNHFEAAGVIQKAQYWLATRG
jgi:hypothetical protein